MWGFLRLIVAKTTKKINNPMPLSVLTQILCPFSLFWGESFFIIKNILSLCLSGSLQQPILSKEVNIDIHLNLGVFVRFCFGAIRI